jgi:poly-beta-1,6-N-acetyl-D-glucosamine N-deacetylase
MQPSHRANRGQSLLSVFLRLAALSLSAMLISYGVASRMIRRPESPAPATPVTASATVEVAPPIQPAVPPTAPIELPGEAYLLNPGTPVTTTKYTSDGVGFLLVQGGIAGTRRSPLRQAVTDFVQESGAEAGLDGTFFANASLTGTDNLLIGPSLCGNESTLTLSPFDKKKQLIGRPLVMMAADRTRIGPYDPNTLDDGTALLAELPGMTDVFLGGVWLVHDGIPVTRKTIVQYNVTDAEDPRRRAFFTLSTDGRPGLGATTFVATSTQLARALADSGVREAVLLDSGFSTSLVANGKILVTGHTLPGLPSRPVPHAIVLFDPKLQPRHVAAATVTAPSASGRV